MRLLETVLLTTDFGLGFEPAKQSAISLAKRFDSKLVLLHVIPELFLPYISIDNDLTDIRNRLRNASEDIEAAGVNAPEIKVGKGPPAEMICNTAANCQANVVVIGCGVRESIGRCRPGVTAERVIRRATTPVWLARPGASPTPKKILCPVDTSRASRRALKNALILSRKFDAQLTVLSIQEPIPGAYRSLKSFSKEAHKSGLEEQQIAFDKFLSGIDFANVNWEKKVRSGATDEEIIAEARELQADLITMGTVGKSGVERILVGSVTQKVIRELPCPVLTMKEEDVIRLRLDGVVATVDEHLKRAEELLATGMLAEAVREFDQCLLAAPTYAVAWDGKAIAFERLGEKTKAEAAKVTAKRIRDELWQHRVEAEIRGHHELLGRNKKSF